MIETTLGGGGVEEAEEHNGEKKKGQDDEGVERQGRKNLKGEEARRIQKGEE